MTLFSRRAAGHLTAVAGFVLALYAPCLAQSQNEQEGLIRDTRQLVQSLRAGGYNIVVRHGATFSNQADTDPYNFDDIARQRNLNDKGKELATAFGNAIRRVGVPVGEVYTSKFNRAYETAVRAGFEGIAQHHRRARQGLVRRQGGRGVDLQARGRQISARGESANGGLATARRHGELTIGQIAG